MTTDASGNVTSTDSTDDPSTNRLAGLPPGATAPGTLTALTNVLGVASGGQTGGASATWTGAKDMRTIITVPKTYLVGPASVLAGLGGILFPYTPNISYDNQANYSLLNPTHSNFPIYFYQKSSMGPITISGKFSNQNEKDGAIYLGIVHLLRALTKMRWGTDKDAGSPPPVCRLNAWGDSMLSNVPVSLASFKIELPEGVDYVAVGTSPQYQGLFGNTMVPTISTINLTLNIMYSRQEMQNYGVDAWLNNTLRGKGYL